VSRRVEPTPAVVPVQAMLLDWVLLVEAA